jgi:hypothetical protein
VAECTLEKFSTCIGQAISVPIAMDNSTAIWLPNPRKRAPLAPAYPEV